MEMARRKPWGVPETPRNSLPIALLSANLIPVGSNISYVLHLILKFFRDSNRLRQIIRKREGLPSGVNAQLRIDGFL